MKMPFGRYKGTELDKLPDSTLHWIDTKVNVEPKEGAPPDLRDQWRMNNQQLKQEARRILSERRRNGVKVSDPPRSNAEAMGRAGFGRKGWRM